MMLINKYAVIRRLMILVCVMLVTTGTLQAQNGAFVRFSLGPGLMKEFTALDGTGPTLASKNHAIGWGFKDNYAIYIGEFGALIKKPVRGYSHINLDAAGIGFIYKTPWDLDLSIGFAPGQVALAENWRVPIGDVDGKGYGVNLSLEKNWLIDNRWNLGIGPQLFYIRTDNRDYDFISTSFNVFINYIFRFNWFEKEK